MSEAPAHCAFYCEENIWHLCEHPRVSGAERNVLIISNPARRVAMWGQKAARDPRLPIAWDYHVVLSFRFGGQPWQIWDLDAFESTPGPAGRWLAASFPRGDLLPPSFAPRFRLVAAADYRRYLRSDRRHMRLADGTPRKPPPPWPPILGEPPACAPTDDGSNLDRFLDTEDPRFVGELFDLRGLAVRLGADQS